MNAETEPLAIYQTEAERLAWFNEYLGMLELETDRTPNNTRPL
jgi:hypothetical protein